MSSQQGLGRGVLRYLVSKYDLSRAQNLAWLQAARDEVRSDLLTMQDVVRGTVAANADEAMDHEAIAEEGLRLRRRLGLDEPHDANTAILADPSTADGARYYELRELYPDAKRCKSAFYKVEMFDDVQPDWQEMFRGATAEDAAWRGDANPQWAGDVIAWRKDQADAPLLVNEFGAMNVSALWAENVPVADYEAAPYLSQLAELADKLTIRIGELRAIEQSGGMTVERLERPVPRLLADGRVVEGEALLEVSTKPDANKRPVRHTVVHRHETPRERSRRESRELAESA